MTPSGLFVLLTGLAVVTALVSTRREMPRLYIASKAVASLGFIAVALASGALGATWSAVGLGALGLAAAGDIALGFSGKRTFLVGLSCFALAHCVYSAAFLFRGTGAWLVATAPAGALVAVGAWLVLRKRLPANMRFAVGGYIIAISAMLATGIATGISYRAPLLVCGVVLVVASDVAVGRERFGSPMFANKLLGLPSYYVGQTLIALSLGG